jgi:hypothetical protein
VAREACPTSRNDDCCSEAPKGLTPACQLAYHRGDRSVRMRRILAFRKWTLATPTDWPSRSDVSTVPWAGRSNPLTRAKVTAHSKHPIGSPIVTCCSRRWEGHHTRRPTFYPRGTPRISNDRIDIFELHASAAPFPNGCSTDRPKRYQHAVRLILSAFGRGPRVCPASAADSRLNHRAV